MRHLMILVGVAALATAGAAAADSTTGDIDIFFTLDNYGIDVLADPNFCGHSNQVPVPPLQSQAPTIYVGPGAPGSEVTVFIWANIDLSDEHVWDNMGIEFGGAGVVVSGELYNQNMGGDCAKCAWTCFQMYRWSDGNDPNQYYGPPNWCIPMTLDSTLEGGNPAPEPWTGYLGVGPRWGDVDYPGQVGDPLAAAVLDAEQGTYRGTYLIGRVTLWVEGDVNMGVSDNLITRAGDPYVGQWGTVAFGRNAPVSGISPGAGLDNPIPDLRVERLGDCNCDGLANFGDIDAFVMALTDPTRYDIVYPDCDVMSADLNVDGAVNFGDIDPFVAIIAAPG